MDAATPKYNVLVVDDLPQICDYFKELFRHMRAVPVDLTTEVSSPRALELLKSRRFDLVISDHRMRGVDGVELLTASKTSNPEGFRVLMTGYNEIPAKLDRIEAAGIDAYLQKPLRTQDLLLAMFDILRRNDAAIGEMRAHARELERLAACEQDPLPAAE